MAELEVGQQCVVQHCRQLDFLPFVCDGCSGIYCLEHRSKDAHHCSGVCSRKPVKSEGTSSYKCTYKSCKTKELLPIICLHCEKNFCLGHRHQSDHNCEKQEVPKSRLVVPQQVVKETVAENAVPLKKGRKGARNSATAAKVALMKMKLHAVGDKTIPQKLRLCHSESGSALPMDQTLELWIANTDYPLINGGIIILEYLDNDCVKLESTNSYME
ncbi:AN1-type zinc finger protein 1 isoform X3 [Carcharodon carcharias]|uniref:AN1-type zinc finger protein 1 isoform X3 n=1 Tax=Carcharodon carcharias TaxID=13397 RepID=UPI001B7E9D4B|nr:AN1-type zinc finger protein 1 isoform X3 [Carcharodon carcharias]